MSHSFVEKKKQENRKRKQHGRKRKSRRCLSQNFGDEKQHFFRYITTGKQKMRKLNHFSRHSKTIQNKKNKCKTCPTKKTDNKVFC